MKFLLRYFLIFLLASCQTIDREQSEIWQLQQVNSSKRITITKGIQKRTLELCGIETLPGAREKLKELITESPRQVPVQFAGHYQGIWYGDLWVFSGEAQESATAILIIEGVARLRDDFRSCPDPLTLQVAQQLADEEVNPFKDGQIQP